jgi:protein subunit release factor A
MHAVIVEVRAGEGGQDARLLVIELVKIYEKFAGRRGL